MGTPAVAREQVACPHGAVTEPQLDVVLSLGEAGQPVSHVEDAGSLLLERGPHHGLELVLRNVDDKGKTSVLSEIAGAHAERGSVGGPVEFPDFVDAQGGIEDVVQCAVTVQDLQRPGEDRACLGVHRKPVVLLEKHHRDAVMDEAERGDEPDRPRADHRDGQLFHGGPQSFG